MSANPKVVFLGGIESGKTTTIQSLWLDGEITAYDQFNKSISSDGFSSMVQLKMSVNVRFTNNTDHEEDFERLFSASRDFDASQSLDSVQEELVEQMIKEIVESIFNAAVANW